MRIYSLLFFLFCIIHSNAQLERSAFKASVGIAGYSQENIQIPSLVLAFSKDFYPKTQIELYSAWMPQVEVLTEETQTDLQAFRFGLHLMYKILSERKQSFHAGLGFSAGLYLSDQTILATQEKLDSAELFPGFSAMIEYHYILPSQWLIGLRASFSNYNENRSTWFSGATLGYRF